MTTGGRPAALAPGGEGVTGAGDGCRDIGGVGGGGEHGPGGETVQFGLRICPEYEPNQNC